VDRALGEFFAEYRIEHQFRLNRQAGNEFRGARRLVERVPELGGGSRSGGFVAPRNWWSGNAGFDHAAVR